MVVMGPLHHGPVGHHVSTLRCVVMMRMVISGAFHARAVAHRVRVLRRLRVVRVVVARSVAGRHRALHVFIHTPDERVLRYSGHARRLPSGLSLESFGHLETADGIEAAQTPSAAGHVRLTFVLGSRRMLAPERLEPTHDICLQRQPQQPPLLAGVASAAACTRTGV